MMLTSKGSKLNSNDSAMEVYSDLGRMLSAEPQYGITKLVIKRPEANTNDRLMSIVLGKCKKINQCMLNSKGKEDQLLIKHMKNSSCLVHKINYEENSTRKYLRENDPKRSN
jgi:hypothetical protein